MNKKLKMSIAIASVIVLSTGTIVLGKHSVDKVKYNKLLTNANELFTQGDFNNSEIKYKDALQLKNSKEVSDKISLIDKIKKDGDNIAKAETLIKEDNLDEAKNILNNIDTSNENVEVKLNTAKENLNIAEKKLQTKKEEERKKEDEQRKEDEAKKAQVKVPNENTENKDVSKENKSNSNSSKSSNTYDYSRINQFKKDLNSPVRVKTVGSKKAVNNFSIEDAAKAGLITYMYRLPDNAQIYPVKYVNNNGNVTVKRVASSNLYYIGGNSTNSIWYVVKVDKVEDGIYKTAIYHSSYDLNYYDKSVVKPVGSAYVFADGTAINIPS